MATVQIILGNPGETIKLLHTGKEASSRHPQVVTLLIDDSWSMRELNKCVYVTESVQNLIIEIQCNNMGSHFPRYIINIAKFANWVDPIDICANPNHIDLDKLSFEGGSGRGKNMADALAWAAYATLKSLDMARQGSNYVEDKSPNPIVMFISDGANSGSDPLPHAQALKSIPFQGGQVDVVVLGIGLGPDDMRIMQSIASRPDLAVAAGTAMLDDFLAPFEDPDAPIGGMHIMPIMPTRKP